MTTQPKTVTEHLRAAQDALTSDREIPAHARMAMAFEHLSQALDAVQLARAEACAALDKF